MAWWKPWEREAPAEPAVITAAAQTSATVRKPMQPQNQTWQTEAWGFYDGLGEFRYAVGWKSEMISRIRLRAGQKKAGQDEPAILDSGPAADVINELGGGIGGQSEMLESLATQINVPGEAYLIGENLNGANEWRVRSTDEIRRRRSQISDYEVIDEVNSNNSVTNWRPLAKNALIVRIWRPHKRLHHIADSPARAMRPTMRELELVNRKIQAQYLSRLASAGAFIVPNEVEFPTRPEFDEEPDAFIAEWIQMASEAIAQPGSASAVVPIPLKVPAEYADKFKFIDFSMKDDERIIEKRESAIRRLATQVDVPAEILLGMGDVNHWCVPDDTKILTYDRGWVSEFELSVGDVVRTLNVDTGLAEWQPVLDVARFDVDNLEMTRIKNKFHDSLSTTAHRWIVDRAGRLTWTTSADLRPNDRIVRSTVTAELPATAKYDDALVELLAWFVTDGTLTRTRTGAPNQVRIGQSHRINPQHVDRIRAALHAWCGSSGNMRGNNPTWREESYADSGMTIFVLNRHARNALLDVMTDGFRKIIATDVIHSLTRAQLELFITTFIAGDGHDRNGSRATSQRDGARLDAVELAAILAGYPVTSGTRTSAGYRAGRLETLRIGKADGDAWHSYDRPRVDHAETERFTGRIWCPVTENTTWLAKRNGQVFFTGNSAWQLEEGAIKTHISSDVEVICAALTKGYLHPMLKAAGESNVDDFVVWYDTSELTSRPNKSDVSKDAYDRLEISGKAYRRELGFDEDDAPSDDDVKEQVLKKLALNPTGGMAALAELVDDPSLAPAPVVPPGIPPSPNQDDPHRNEAKPPETSPQQQRQAAPQGDRPSEAAATSVPTLPELPPPPNVYEQAQERHRILFNMDRWTLYHPGCCTGSVMRCPVAEATRGLKLFPGQSGTYECWLSGTGEFILGRRTYERLDTWVQGHTRQLKRKALTNGHR